MAKWIVSVGRTGFSGSDIEVVAATEESAEEIALDSAGDISFTEHESRYEVQHTVRVPDPPPTEEPKFEGKMVPGEPDTWPPATLFDAQYRKRFPETSPKWKAEYVASFLEYLATVSTPNTFATRDRIGSLSGAYDEDAVAYWRLFWTFEGPLYERYKLEFDNISYGVFYRPETRDVVYVPASRNVTMHDAKWEEV